MTALTRNRGRALIVGLGIAGMASAIRLQQAGWETVVIERAPARRDGGYFIALFGAGAAPAGRLGVLDALRSRAHANQVSLEIDRHARRKPGLGFTDLPHEPRVLLRGDVESALHQALPAGTEIRYSTTPTAVEQDDGGVRVTLRDAGAGTVRTERFDLLVGADGLRSTVRSLVFGPHSAFLRPVNHMIAAFLMKEHVHGFEPHEAIALTEPGRSAWTFPLSGRPPSALFSYRTTDIDREFKLPPADSVRRAFGPEPLGPVLGQLLDEFEHADGLLFDSVHQSVLPHWHARRVVVVGDAAWCPTLYTGMGASSALAGADLLGTMIERHPDSVEAALGAWEAHLRPFIEYHQHSLPLGLNMFVPQSHTGKILRGLLTRNLPFIGPLALRLKTRATEFQMKERDIAKV
ncbi:FAD-dependent oxidoreductase [Streptomyces sulfonofaciens]|uniref:FAD-dependent oxidoreductase n=1 Tax=Streptomyces sulfonofaciens TaxID=68272 RepID=A0A919L5Y3_9ACTN|nr:FAD-dependent monooxygenase [Streptomyces sulfonofaciens]GHH84654.1 FAD-dependent oxidoreductase [Streptomyces sulfonofaciens]